MILYATRGLPGSGKSTIARQMVLDRGGDLIRVNRDDLRTMLHIDVFSRSNEKITQGARDALVRLGLSRGRDVIVDDTGFGSAHAELRALADEAGATFEVIDVPTPLDVCIVRNEMRIAKGERGVPEFVIHRMYNDHVKGKLWGQ